MFRNYMLEVQFFSSNNTEGFSFKVENCSCFRLFSKYCFSFTSWIKFHSGNIGV